jgi:hypothetical protein
LPDRSWLSYWPALATFGVVHDKVGGRAESTEGAADRGASPAVGKRTQVDALPSLEATAGAPIQRASSGEAHVQGVSPASIARQGTEGSGGRLPHYDRIQSLFGHHDISGVTSHEGPAAASASDALGARAFAHGNAVAFGSSPDLHTAAHEAAHVVQQRGGVQLKGGLDQPGDAYERHADAVADAVVAGKSAQPLLDTFAPGGPREAVVQRAPVAPEARVTEEAIRERETGTSGAKKRTARAARADAKRGGNARDPDPNEVQVACFGLDRQRGRERCSKLDRELA